MIMVEYIDNTLYICKICYEKERGKKDIKTHIQENHSIREQSGYIMDGERCMICDSTVQGSVSQIKHVKDHNIDERVGLIRQNIQREPGS